MPKRPKLVRSEETSLFEILGDQHFKLFELIDLNYHPICEHSLVKEVEWANLMKLELSKELGEIFTPEPLARQMILALDMDWSDPNLTYFDPCSGNGIYSAICLEILMEHQHTDESLLDKRKRILESQIYMGEYQSGSCQMIEALFDPYDNVSLNLYQGDTLKMPADFFDLSYRDRAIKYPEHCTAKHISRCK